MKMWGREGTNKFYRGKRESFSDVEVTTVKPHRLDILQNGVWVDGPGKAEAIAEAQRHIEIDEAKEASGLRHITVAQANAFIDNQLNDATTILGLRSATKRILKKMVPFLINGGS